MTCEDSNVTFSFFDGDGGLLFEIRPQTMRFDRDEGEFDFVRAKFSQEVAELFERHRNGEDGLLDKSLPVYINLDGMTVHRMLYLPDGVTIGVNNLHIELHDILKTLTRGVVDYQKKSVNLEEAFTDIFEMRDTSEHDILEGIRFPNDSLQINEIASSKFGDGRNYDLKAKMDARDDIGDYFTIPYINPNDDVERDYKENLTEMGVELIDGKYAIDEEHVSPWKAMQNLAKKFGVDIWTKPDGYVYVGIRGDTGVGHLAAPDDSRVWKLSEYNISPPRTPVIKAVVRGNWMHDPDESLREEARELFNFDRARHDYRPEGVAEIPDAYYGDVVTFEAEADKGTLEKLAKRKLIQERMNQWSGSIELMPSHSGNEWSDIRTAEIGDLITTIPPDDSGEYDCKSNVVLESFRINGIRHKLTEDGEWRVRLTVVPADESFIGSIEPETYLRYFDPHNEKTLSAEEAYG